MLSKQSQLDDEISIRSDEGASIHNKNNEFLKPSKKIAKQGSEEIKNKNNHDTPFVSQPAKGTSGKAQNKGSLERPFSSQPAKGFSERPFPPLPAPGLSDGSGKIKNKPIALSSPQNSTNRKWMVLLCNNGSGSGRI